MLIFYYGLLFLATLCISDGVATFLVLCLVDFLLLKAIWEDYKPFVTWRKKQYKPLIKLKKSATKSFLKRWKKAPLLKRAYIIVAGVVGFSLLILFTRLYLEVLWISWDDIGDDDKIRNLAIAFVGTITGIGALFGVYLAILRSEENKRQNEIAHSQSRTAIRQSQIALRQSQIANKQADTEEQGMITDRINKATEGLGKNENGRPILEVRLGSLYALERIAQDSIRDHVQIMEMLCAYIRTNRPLSSDPDKVIPISEDIQAALNIIGRRENWTEDKKHLEKEHEQKYNLDLRKCDLQGAQLDNACLNGTNFDGTDLRKAQLNRAQLRSASLNNTDLSEAQLERADISHAELENADLSGAKLYDANMSHMIIKKAKLINARIYDADMSYARIFRSDLSRASFYNSTLTNTLFYNTDMSYAGFTRTKLNDANLSTVNLSYARFKDTNMNNINLEETYAYKCNFLECDGLTQIQLEEMFCGIEAEIPDNLHRPDHWPEEDLTYEEFKIARNTWVEEREEAEAEAEAEEAMEDAMIEDL